MKKKILLVIIILVFFAVLGDRLFSKESQDMTKESIYLETKIKIPENSNILFTHKKIGLRTAVFFIKIRINKSSWKEFINSPLFLDSSMIENENIFKRFDDNLDGWNPQDVQNATSGVINNDNAMIKYLFDISGKEYIDIYFKVLVE